MAKKVVKSGHKELNARVEAATLQRTPSLMQSNAMDLVPAALRNSRLDVPPTPALEMLAARYARATTNVWRQIRVSTASVESVAMGKPAATRRNATLAIVNKASAASRLALALANHVRFLAKRAHARAYLQGKIP
jgi:hypothetical protein